jgi:SAM-dependent methyltransferase
MRRLRAAGIDGGLAVDLGCGSGIWARLLVDAGYEVLGVDISADMLDIARGRVPEGRFVHGSAHEIELPPCVAVTAIGEVLGYGDADLGPVFEHVSAALRPGGLFLFDLAGPGREPEPRHLEVDGPGWHMQVDMSERDGVLTRRIDLGDAVETHVLRLHTPADVLGTLARAGFAHAETIDSYGDELAMPPALVAFSASR